MPSMHGLPAAIYDFVKIFTDYQSITKVALK